MTKNRDFTPYEPTYGQPNSRQGLFISIPQPPEPPVNRGMYLSEDGVPLDDHGIHIEDGDTNVPEQVLLSLPDRELREDRDGRTWDERYNECDDYL